MHNETGQYSSTAAWNSLVGFGVEARSVQLGTEREIPAFEESSSNLINCDCDKGSKIGADCSASILLTERQLRCGRPMPRGMQATEDSSTVALTDFFKSGASQFIIVAASRFVRRGIIHRHCRQEATHGDAFTLL